MVLLTAVVFIVLLLVLVLVHEWGHFMAAKKAGCTVEEFGFGFPPRLFSFERGGTRYSFNLLPLGGFVKIEGEDMTGENSPTSFASKSTAWRIVILAAGVFMNILLAYVLLTIQAGIGTQTLATADEGLKLPGTKTYITDISANSPAARAGLQTLDRIVRIENINEPSIGEVQAIIKEKAGQTIAIEIERQGLHKNITAQPRLNPPPHEGALGIGLVATALQKVPWWQAPWAGAQKTWFILTEICKQFWLLLVQLVQHQSVPAGLMGPVGLVAYTNEVTKLGVSYLLEFAALISLNLALLNILPFPALDGGRIMFVLLEKIFGRASLHKVEQVSHSVGFGLLILLMVAITYQDIHRLLVK